MLRRPAAHLRRCIPASPRRAGLHDGLMSVHPAVSQALADRRPVVALESTIVTHGMPYPHNLNTAKEVESIVRAHGAVPATVGVLQGRLHVGLTGEELDFLARCRTALKVSRRDLPYVVSKGLSGGTTVSGTMIAAHGAGIPVFVTGGIGGVHRDGENTLDISADLTELGRTPIAVVSAGVKSILDIGRTLEFLETQGVCVATYGRSKKFPAFFSPESGYASPYNVCSPEEAAELVASTLSLGLRSGVLLAVPIPDGHSAGGLQIEEAIQRAVREASSNGIIGRDVTPFILQRVVVGGVNVDFIAKAKTEKLLLGQTNCGSVGQSFGGVGRNIADCLSRLDQTPLFISAIGLDAHGENVLTSCKHMNTSAIARLKEQRTATYCAVITEKGELSLGLGDMDIHQQIKAECVSQYEDQLAAASLVCVDGNVPVSTIDYICFVAEKFAVPVWFEPTDADKACKPFLSQSWKALTYTSPNLTELCTMNRALGLPTPAVLPISPDEQINCAAALSRPLLEHIQCVIVTLGSMGVLVCGEHKAPSVNLQPKRPKNKGRLCAVHYPAVAVTGDETVNVSGAGDSLAGGMMVGILRGCDTHTCVRMGLLAARLSLSSPHPIAPTLDLDSVHPLRAHRQPWPEPTCLWMES